MGNRKKTGRKGRGLKVLLCVIAFIAVFLAVINIIPLFVFAFASGINKNSKNYASAILVLMLIGLIIAVCAAFLVFARTDPTVLHDFILKYFRLSIEF